MTRKSPIFIGSHRFWAVLVASLLLVGLLPGAVLAAAPAAPSVPDLASGSDTGNSQTDNITQTLHALVFTGTAEAGSTVTILAGGVPISSGTDVATGGVYSVTTNVDLPDSTANLITAFANNGVDGPASGPLTVTTDNTVPSAPSAPNLDAASDTGTSNSDNYTSDTTPTFSGTSEPNASIQLFVGGTTVVGSGVASGAGTWNITSSAQSSGVYSFTAKQTDAAGNGPSVASSALSPVTIDTTVPATPSAPNLDAASDSGSSPTDNITSDTTPTFTGTADASTLVDLFAGSTQVGETTSDVSGNWTITASALSAGTYSMTAKALNLAGSSPASSALSLTIYTSLTVTVSQQAGQLDPTATSPINFTVVFSNPVSDFTTGDVTLTTGTAGGTLVGTVTGSGTTYTVAVTGMTTAGTVIATIAAGKAVDAAGNANLVATFTDHTVTWSPGSPSVTINQASTQVDPTGTSPINFTVVFSVSVTGFLTGDVLLSSSTAGGILVGTVTGSGTTYNVAVSGMTTAGTVIATVPASVATATSGGQPNLVSTSTDNSVTWAPGSTTVTINQASGQADPTATSPINFTVVFSASVTGFATGDVTLTGTAGGTLTATVTGSGTTYNVAVTGMTTAGTVIATIPAGVAINASSQSNLASSSTDNTVTWAPVAATITLTTSAPTPPGAHSPVILWGQGFTLGVQFGTNGANRSFQLQAMRDGVTWNPIATLTTNASGHASFIYTPVTNLYYRAVFAGAADLSAATSNLVRTVVRELAVLRPTNSGSTRTINRNTSITFTTTVRPSRPELAPATVNFYFYRFSSGAYRLVTTRNVSVNAAGLASTTFKFTTSGQWYVRSQANPTPYNANSVMTPLERYSVR